MTPRSGGKEATLRYTESPRAEQLSFAAAAAARGGFFKTRGLTPAPCAYCPLLT